MGVWGDWRLHYQAVRWMCVLVGFLLAEDSCGVTFFPSCSRRSAMGLFLPPLGHSGSWWALCRSHQLHLTSGISGTERSGGTHAGGVRDTAFTTRHYEAGSQSIRSSGRGRRFCWPGSRRPWEVKYQTRGHVVNHVQELGGNPPHPWCSLLRVVLQSSANGVVLETVVNSC